MKVIKASLYAQIYEKNGTTSKRKPYRDVKNSQLVSLVAGHKHINKAVIGVEKE